MLQTSLKALQANEKKAGHRLVAERRKLNLLLKGGSPAPSLATMDGSVAPSVYENTCMRGDKVNCSEKECYYSGVERCCMLKDGLPDDTKCRNSNFASIAAQKWNNALETAKKKIKKVMDAAMKAELVKKCTPCLSTHEYNGHTTGVSMKEWEELGCDECLGKDKDMGSEGVERWVTFQEYKKKRSAWESAMARPHEERKQRSQRVDRLRS